MLGNKILKSLKVAQFTHGFDLASSIVWFIIEPTQVDSLNFNIYIYIYKFRFPSLFSSNKKMVSLDQLLVDLNSRACCIM